MSTPEKLVHKVGRTYVVETGGRMVRFTVAEFFASSRGSEGEREMILKTAKGQFLYYKPYCSEYKVYQTLNDLLEGLAKELNRDVAREMFEKIGGRLEDVLPEV